MEEQKEIKKKIRKSKKNEVKNKNVGKIYAYIRVSTSHQDTENQRFEINKYCDARGLHVDSWENETISGVKDIKQRKLQRIISEAKAGDKIICTEVSRLGRSMQIISEIMRICIEKQIGIYTLKENYSLDKDDPMAKLILQIYGYAAETERKLIIERTKEGLATARRKGKTLGRPKGSKSKHTKMDKYHDELIIGLARGKSKAELSRKFGVHVCTIYEYINLWDVYKDVDEYRMDGMPRKWSKYN